MPDQVGLELIAGQLEESIPGSVLATAFFRNRAAVEVAPTTIRAVLATPEQRAGAERDGAINVFPGGDTAGA